MIPTFSPNDKVMVSSLPYFFSSPKIGDTIVFKFEKKFLIKKITRVDGEWYMVNGENKTDSLKVPKLIRKEILGKVVRRISI